MNIEEFDFSKTIFDKETNITFVLLSYSEISDEDARSFLKNYVQGKKRKFAQQAGGTIHLKIPGHAQDIESC